MHKQLRIMPLLLALILLLSGCGEPILSVGETGLSAVPPQAEMEAPTPASDVPIIDMDHLPDYSGSPWVAVNGNLPDFAEELKTTQSSEYYVELDQLGRCGACFANIGRDLMPTEPRGSISSVHPSGWMQNQYDFVDGKSLYNRCHLIGFQLTGENDNDHNLITGTRYLNVEGMLPFEEEVAAYIKSTGNHVLYRVTPVFDGSELVARGVHMEALSVEDDGKGVCFNVYCYNVQPGVIIDYLTGDNWAAPGYGAEGSADSAGITYILNTNTQKFHEPGCASAEEIAVGNRQEFTGTRQQLLDQGYTPCGRCKP